MELETEKQGRASAQAPCFVCVTMDLLCIPHLKNSSFFPTLACGVLVFRAAPPHSLLTPPPPRLLLSSSSLLLASHRITSYYITSHHITSHLTSHHITYHITTYNRHTDNTHTHNRTMHITHHTSHSLISRGLTSSLTSHSLTSLGLRRSAAAFAWQAWDLAAPQGV